MNVWGEKQWAVTGDTYPVGCLPDESIVYGVRSFEGNPDNPLYKFVGEKAKSSALPWECTARAVDWRIC